MTEINFNHPVREARPPLLKKGGEFLDISTQRKCVYIRMEEIEKRNNDLEQNKKISLNNLPHLKTFRTKLRQNLTPAEASFWKIVKNKNFEGRKFRRQHSIGKYILDFYCPSEKLAVELDGEVHFNEKAREYDYERRLFLEFYGIKVLRFENKRVFEDLQWMLDVIKSNFGWNKKQD